MKLPFTADIMKKIAPPSVMTARYISSDYAFKNWPLVQPEYVFALEAVDIFGKAIFGQDWTGWELLAVKWPISPISIYANEWSKALVNVEASTYIISPRSIVSAQSGGVIKPQTREEFDESKANLIELCNRSLASIPDKVAAVETQWQTNKATAARLLKAVRWLGDKCRGRDIAGAYQFKGWPKLYNDMSPDLWNGSSDIERWAASGGYSQWVKDRNYDTLVFVSREDLNREIAALDHAPLLLDRAELSRLAPDLQLAVRLALEHQLFDANNAGLKSGQVEHLVIAAAEQSGRQIAKGRMEEIARLMRWPDEKRSAAGQKSAAIKK